MVIQSFRYGNSEEEWRGSSFWVKLWVGVIASVFIPWGAFREFRVARRVQRLFRKAEKVWRGILDKGSTEIDTLEGLRGFLKSETLGSFKAFKLKGEFQVTTPIQVCCDSAVLDMSEAVLFYTGCPVFDMSGSMNAVIGLTILDVPDVDNFQMIGEDDSCLVKTQPSTGNVFLKLNVGSPALD